MTNKECVKQFKAVLNKADKLKSNLVSNEVYFREIEPLKEQYKKYVQMGVIPLLSKAAIFRAVQFQSSFRPMAEHRFYIHFLNK